MKTLLTVILFLAAIFFIAAPSFAMDDFHPSHFSKNLETDWDTEATGHMVLYFYCPIIGNSYASLHDVVYQGFGVTEESIKGWPFPVRYVGIQTPAGHYGYVFKKHASVYLRLLPDHGPPRWIRLALDPSEDGLNGNEILR